MSARGRSVERLWARYAGSIAFLALVVIAALGFARIENARYEGCEGGNLLREGLRTAEEEDIAQTETLDAGKLFPQIPPAELKQLLEEGAERSRHRINVLYAPRDCGTKIDLPLTGAAIVFPP